MRVLLSAYACIPHAGSEYGFGWGWATHLAARGLEVCVFTAAENRAAVEAEIQNGHHPSLNFVFVPSVFARAKPWNGVHYLGWQIAALREARRVHKQKPFDVVHHVTFGSIHVPTFLVSLGIPVIFGPVGGGQTAPFRLLSYFGRSAWKELLRTCCTLLLPLSPIHRWCFRRMSLVLATNYETLTLARRMGSRQTLLSMDTGLPANYYTEQPRTFVRTDAPVRLLWTGRMMPRKALSLTLDGLAASGTPARLTVVGGGLPKEMMRQMTEDRNLTERVSWAGILPWKDVRHAYSTHDAFLFTSLRDSFGSQHLEAMATGLPVLTLDMHGAHALIPEDAAIKIPVTGKRSTIAAIAAAIDRFASYSPDKRNRMSQSGWMEAKKHSWEAHSQMIEEIYCNFVARSAG